MIFENLQRFKKEGKIGVIGGLGRMGKWALNLFNSLDYENLYFNDIVEDMDKEIPFAKFIDKKELVKICDLIIISVPISKTIKVINEIGPYVNENSIFSDFTSIKEKSCKQMSKYSNKAIGIHPMFKENLNDLKNRNIVLTPTKPNLQKIELNFLENMFKETGARIRIVSPKMHDQITSFNQAGVHLIFLTYGFLLKNYCRKNDLDLKDLESLNTPNSQLMNILLSRFLSTRNYDVLWEIQNSTKDSKEIRKLFLESVENVVNLLNDKDKKQFQFDIEAISRKFKKVRLLIESKESDEIVNKLNSLGVETNLDKLKNEISLTLNLIRDNLSIILNSEINDKIKPLLEKMNNLFNNLEKNFEKNEIKELIKDATFFKRYIDKTILKGKKIQYSAIHNYLEIYYSLKNLLDKLVNTANELILLEKLIKE